MAEDDDQLELDFVDPNEFENFDTIDSEDVVLADDSYDEKSATDEEVND